MNGTELTWGLGRDDLVGAPPARCVPARESNAPFVVRSTVGRLVEIQLYGPPGDVAAMINAAVVAAISSLDGLAIIVADHRKAKPFPHVAGDAWCRGMRVVNERVMRSAILIDPANETFNLQLARVIRCAGSPQRRRFDHPSKLRAWLCEVVTPCELARLDVLLGG